MIGLYINVYKHIIRRLQWFLNLLIGMFIKYDIHLETSLKYEIPLKFRKTHFLLFCTTFHSKVVEHVIEYGA